MAFLRTYLEPLLAPAKFQPQAHDRVLREEQRRKNAFAEVCICVMNNPVRAGLIESADKWDYIGCILPGYPSLHPLQDDFWRIFWNIYRTGKNPDAGNIKRPPLNVCPPA